MEGEYPSPRTLGCLPIRKFYVGELDMFVWERGRERFDGIQEGIDFFYKIGDAWNVCGIYEINFSLYTD